MAIAPWLTPPNFLAAMQAGAQLGLGVRRQDEEESQAGDRLRLAYDQLAANERRAHEAVMARQESAKAALALRAQQMSALESYRQSMIEERKQADALREANQQRLADQFTAREDRITKEFGLRETERGEREKRLGEQFQQKEERLGRLMAATNLERQLTTLTKEREKAEEAASWLHRGTRQRAADLRTKEDALRDRIADLTEKDATPATTPAPKTGRVRVKSPDGKIGTIPSDQLEEAKAAGYTVVQ